MSGGQDPLPILSACPHARLPRRPIDRDLAHPGHADRARLGATCRYRGDRQVRVGAGTAAQPRRPSVRRPGSRCSAPEPDPRIPFCASPLDPVPRRGPDADPGDTRSADITLDGATFDGIVGAETRLDDVQAVERQIRGKQQELGSKRAILLVLDSRHNRAVIDQVAELREQFPIGGRACLAALRRGGDPGGDCLVLVRTIATKRRLNAADPLTPQRARSHPVRTAAEPV
jgi:hypothetical protein